MPFKLVLTGASNLPHMVTIAVAAPHEAMKRHLPRIVMYAAQRADWYPEQVLFDGASVVVPPPNRENDVLREVHVRCWATDTGTTEVCLLVQYAPGLPITSAISFTLAGFLATGAIISVINGESVGWGALFLPAIVGFILLCPSLERWDTVKPLDMFERELRRSLEDPKVLAKVKSSAIEDASAGAR